MPFVSYSPAGPWPSFSAGLIIGTVLYFEEQQYQKYSYFSAEGYLVDHTKQWEQTHQGLPADKPNHPDLFCSRLWVLSGDRERLINSKKPALFYKCTRTFTPPDMCDVNKNLSKNCLFDRAMLAWHQSSIRRAAMSGISRDLEGFSALSGSIRRTFPSSAPNTSSTHGMTTGRSKSAEMDRWESGPDTRCSKQTSLFKQQHKLLGNFHLPS